MQYVPRHAPRGQARACPVCDAPGNPLSTWYLACGTCGTRYYRELPSQAELTEVYGGGAWKRFRRRLLSPFRRMQHVTKLTEKRDRAARILARILAAVSARQGRFLDIGCHKGFLLEAARASGFEVWGLEVSAEQIAPFVNSYPETRARVLTGSAALTTRALPDGHFSVVTAIDVVEHLEDPVATFTDVRRILAPGGVFVVQTPDAASPEAVRDGAGWYEMKPVEHLQLFTAASLDRLARRAGFRAFELFETPFETGCGNMAGRLVT